jgi:hypothetical protein
MVGQEDYMENLGDHMGNQTQCTEDQVGYKERQVEYKVYLVGYKERQVEYKVYLVGCKGDEDQDQGKAD